VKFRIASPKVFEKIVIVSLSSWPSPASLRSPPP
jgi:hypothetical protein